MDQYYLRLWIKAYVACLRKESATSAWCKEMADQAVKDFRKSRETLS